ncbi:DoxX family protein [Bradyrhizobium sp. LM2.9]
MGIRRKRLRSNIQLQRLRRLLQVAEPFFPAPELFTATNIALEILISVSLVLGIGTRFCAVLTFMFVLVATAIAHRYWEYPSGAQQIGQYNHFLKNISIMGGAMLIFVTGAGRFSFDRKM